MNREELMIQGEGDLDSGDILSDFDIEQDEFFEQLAEHAVDPEKWGEELVELKEGDDILEGTDILDDKSDDEMIVEEFKLKKIPIPVNIDVKSSEGITPIFSKRLLTVKQELFCRYYASSTYRGDYIMAYCKSYKFNPTNKKEYAFVRYQAGRMIKNKNISKRISILLKEEGLNESDVDSELNFLIKQRQDFAAKISAIKEYNKMTGRTKEQMELTGKGGTPFGIQFYIPMNGRESPEMLAPPEDKSIEEERGAWEELDQIESNE